MSTLHANQVFDQQALDMTHVMSRPPCCHLVGLVDVPSEQVVVQEGQVVRGDVEVGVGDTNVHGVVLHISIAF